MRRRIFREPLVHFLLAGVVLYGAYALVADTDAVQDASRIVVDRRALLSFMQFRANAFDPDSFGAALDSMTQDELQQLIDAYVDEEVLFREAESLGLDANDYIIRQRMVQKISFLLGDVADRSAAGDEDELRAWFERNADAYAIQPWTTFTHVFFDADRRGVEGARQAAEAARVELMSSGAQFSDAAGYGDRFPFLRNYVERTHEYVASHFGDGFAAELAGLQADAGLWQGPIGSALGQHVVLVTRQVERAYPRFDEVRETVERDFAAEHARSALADVTRAVRDRYEIEILDLRSVVR